MDKLFKANFTVPYRYSTNIVYVKGVLKYYAILLAGGGVHQKDHKNHMGEGVGVSKYWQK